MIYFVKEWDPEDEGYEPEETFVDFNAMPYKTVLALLESQREGSVEHMIRAVLEHIEWLDGSCCGTVKWTEYIDPSLFFDSGKPVEERFQAVGLPHVLRELLAAHPKLDVASAFAAEIEKL